MERDDKQAFSNPCRDGIKIVDALHLHLLGASCADRYVSAL